MDKYEQVAYWYFRLNGFLTITNFINHPDKKGSQLTEFDIVGVRFPYRAELVGVESLADDNIFNNDQKTKIIIADATSEDCKLNKTWTKGKRKSENLDRLLKAIGILKPEDIKTCAKSLYDGQEYQTADISIQLFCIGMRVSGSLKKSHPGAIQKDWKDVIIFIYNRFRKYRAPKADHKQWDEMGYTLYNICKQATDELDFYEQVKNCCKPLNTHLQRRPMPKKT